MPKSTFWIRRRGKNPVHVNKPIKQSYINKHRAKLLAIGLSPIRPGESTTKVALLDLDNHGDDPKIKSLAVAKEVAAAAEEHGLVATVFTSSGGSGVHVYFIWDEPQDAHSVRATLEDVLLDCLIKPGTGGLAKNQVEVFPKQDKVAKDEFGSMFILPLAFASKHVAGDWSVSKPVKKRKPPVEKKSAKAAELPDWKLVKTALAAIPNNDLDYDQWRNIVFAVHAATGGSLRGRRLAEQWSAQSKKHDVEFFRKRVWPYIKKGRGITPQTLFWHAREGGWNEDIKAKFDDLGEEEEENGATGGGVSGKGGKTLTASAPEDRSLRGFTRDNKGAILPIAQNLEIALRQAMPGGHLGYDQFTQSVMVKNGKANWEPFRETDNVAMRIALEKRGFKPIGKELMRDVVLLVAEENTFDTARIWLDSLQWDGAERCGEFLPRYFGAADNEYARAVSLYWWTAQAGRIIEPGIQADMVPVLIGEQGVGKSRALEAMVPSRDHVVEIDLTERDADLARVMQGRLIGEIAELRGLNSREYEHIKAFITRTQEKWVPKYQEQARVFDRRLCFVGTTNETDFLNDPSGNRRWLPVEVNTIERERIAADRDQLWAEAAVIYRERGIAYAEAHGLADPFRKMHEIHDPWELPIRRWLDDVIETAEEPNAVIIQTSEALTGAGIMTDISRITIAHQRRAAGILKKCGWRNDRFYGKGGTRKRGWKLMQLAKDYEFV